MRFNSYITSEIKTAFSVPIAKELLPKKSLKQKAFTLAETLITLSIIGVVAAMTVPTLMSNINKHGYVTGLKKAHTQLLNAWRMLPITENCPAGDYQCTGFFYDATDIDGESFENDIAAKSVYLISKHFKNVKYCKTIDECKKLIPYPADAYPYIRYGFQTADGMFYFSGDNGGATHIIAVDVNGPKGPNRFNRDRFIFQSIEKGHYYNNTIQSESKIIAGGPNCEILYKLGCSDDSRLDNGYHNNATYCVLTSGKMDY